jgi:plastocyanin
LVREGAARDDHGVADGTWGWLRQRQSARQRREDRADPVVGKIDFSTPGTYRFVCLIHPFMQGTIIVK